MIRYFMDSHIVVLGDVFLDEYLFGDCHRISPEAPVPILSIDQTKTKITLGGAGNTAANVVSLGGKCTLIGRIGLDDDGQKVKELCEKQGIRFIPIPQSENRVRTSGKYPTPKKTRLVGQRQQLLRIDKEDIQPLAPEAMGGALFYYKEVLEKADAVVLSDYAKGFFSLQLAQQIIARAETLDKPVIVDPKPANQAYYEGCTYMTPNLKEFTEMNGPLTANILLTKGAEGMEYYGTDGSHFVRPTMAKEVFDVAGAGDTVVAAFSLAIAAKMPIEEAIDFANKAAGVVVGKQGTSIVTQEEIEKFA